MITILGKEFDFSFTRPADVKKWVEGRKAIAVKHRELESASKGAVMGVEDYAAVLEECCQMYCELFDNMLGRGAAELLFKDRQPVDFNDCLDAYDEFEKAFTQFSEQYEKKVRDKYAPVGKKGK